MNILEAIKEMENGKTVEHGYYIFKMKISKWSDGSELTWEIYRMLRGHSDWNNVMMFDLDQILSDEWKVCEDE